MSKYINEYMHSKCANKHLLRQVTQRTEILENVLLTLLGENKSPPMSWPPALVRLA